MADSSVDAESPTNSSYKAVAEVERSKQIEPDSSSANNVAPPSIVASHYNALPQVGIHLRNDSRILHLRNFNNWMKSMLIGDFLERLQGEGTPHAKVIDLCCGKGGDLRKWRIGRIQEIVMADIAEVSLQDCRDRFYSMRDRRSRQLPFRAHFIAGDLCEISLRDRFSAETPAEFDLSSCQFALHYSFRNEQCARRLLRNATESLRPGGYFIGTVPDASAIIQYLRRGNGKFGNQVCTISMDNADAQAPLFGAEIRFHLEGVVDCPEYLCYFPLLAKLLGELGLEPVYSYSFPEAIQYYLRTRGKEASDLMVRMNALETVEGGRLEGKETQEYGPAIAQLCSGAEGTRKVGTLSKSEWQVVTMYRVFAFRKTQTLATDSTESGGIAPSHDE